MSTWWRRSDKMDELTMSDYYVIDANLKSYTLWRFYRFVYDFDCAGIVAGLNLSPGWGNLLEFWIFSKNLAVSWDQIIHIMAILSICV